MSYPPSQNPAYGAPQGQNPPQGGQYPPPQGGQYPPQGGAQYPPQGGQYPPPQGGQYPPQGGQYPPQGGQYPPQGGVKPGQLPPMQGAQGSQYPPQQGGAQYPPQQGQYPPQGGAQYPPQGGQYPPQGGAQYPPQQGGQYPQQGGQYPPQQQGGWGNSFYNQINPQELQMLQSWFSSVDTDRSGTISAQELAGLQFFGKVLGYNTAKKLIKVFDKNYSGSIDFQEYASLHQFLNRMQVAFVQADQDRSGLLDAREIHGALQSAGFQLSLQTVQALCSKFDTSVEKRGLSFEQFLQVCAHLATVRSIFEWNDTTRSGKVTFSYDQLAHVTIHLMD